MNNEVKTINGYDIKDAKAIRTYDTVSDMKSDRKLKVGQHVKTRGYYSNGDGGSAEYYITNTQSESEYQENLENGLYATLFINDSVNVKQFGVNEDVDVTTKLNNMFAYLEDKNVTNINFTKNGNYIIEGQVNINGDYKINGNNSTISFTTKPENTNLKVFNIESDRITQIENLNIDGSQIDQDQWDITSVSNLNIRRIFYITSKNIILNNINIKNVWGNGVQLYGYDNVSIENCNFDKIGGGFYYTDSQTGANDFFGDGIYLGYHDDEARVLIKNTYLNGYVSSIDEKGSRGGLVLENLNEEHSTMGKTYITLKNYGLTNFNRAIHCESYPSDTIINLLDGSIKQDSSICNSGNNDIRLFIEKSNITHTPQAYNGSHSFRGFKTVVKDSIINIQDTATDVLCHGGDSYIEYYNCEINNINDREFNNGKCKIYDSILNFNNSMTQFLIYGSDVDIYNSTFNNSTNTDKNMYRGGSKFNAYNCVFNNINPYVTLKDIKSIFYFASNLSEQYMYGYLANGTIYVNNNLKYKPNIGYTFNATDLVNTDNVLTVKEFGESSTVPLIPNPLPNNFEWNCCAKYLMIVSGGNSASDPYTKKFRNACYFVTVVTNDSGVPSVSGEIQTSSSAPSGWNRVLEFDTTNNTISKGADHSSSVNRVSYWILPYEYYNSTNF